MLAVIITTEAETQDALVATAGTKLIELAVRDVVENEALLTVTDADTQEALVA